MKVLVTTKRVTDPEANIKLKADNTGIVTDGVEYKLNPFDENAVEAALQLREAHGGEVVVISVGPEEAKTYMRTALAMGADRGIMVAGDDDNLDGDLVARILAELYKREQPDIFLLGKQCIDGDSNQVGQLLAEYLGLPQACFASELEIGDGNATVSREVDGGIEVINVDLPAIITADLRLNEPRFYGLPGIIKARKKEILDFTQEELGVSTQIKVATQRYEPPSERLAGVIVESVSELVEKLQNEAKVL
ncbi:MAG TPA: electron transfer flavoprotein subunit beta/FixA family protein [Myxococcales bacterium]|nr:electron transfer flavoprotein subunit beta/FixA family protein [Myxococcales bacterium]HIN85783.1 electron transfer flavoprotein subunit beta/FixA family protein [Myxococcales bacterium]